MEIVMRACCRRLVGGGRRFVRSYCNTVPTPDGGSHEAGLRAALTRELRGWGEHRGNRRAAQITAEYATTPLACKLSVFLREPQFQGQTKSRLTSPEASRLFATRSIIGLAPTQSRPIIFWHLRSRGQRSASGDAIPGIHLENRSARPHLWPNLRMVANRSRNSLILATGRANVVALVKSLASAIAIGSGAAVGREGAIIQIGS